MDVATLAAAKHLPSQGRSAPVARAGELRRPFGRVAVFEGGGIESVAGQGAHPLQGRSAQDVIRASVLETGRPSRRTNWLAETFTSASGNLPFS